jgi:hypothetical protein
MKLVDAIHEGSGPESARLPRRLIIRAAYRNHHSNMALNEASVVSKVHEYVTSEMQLKAQKKDVTVGESVDETNKALPQYQVGYAVYNHQTKELIFDNPFACFEWEDRLQFTDLPPRTDSIQSPEYCIISFGSQTIPLAVRELLPYLCGVGSEKYIPPADNAFRTVASIPTEATLLCALAEAMYAILHKVHPHKDDMNFADLKKVVLVCDNDEYVAVVKRLMQYPEFIEEYLPALKLLQPEGLVVVNLNLDKPEQAAEQLVIGY